MQGNPDATARATGTRAHDRAPPGTDGSPRCRGCAGGVKPERPPLVSRVVRVARPDRIIPFGSAARGTMHEYSDLDVLVVKQEPFDYDELTDAVYELPIPVAIRVATPVELERCGRSPYLVYCSALAEGRVLYEQTRGFTGAAAGAPAA